MSKKNGYYISLGAGDNQIPLIQAAKARDLLVIGVDQNINASGMSLCDLKIEESILNYRKIHSKILKLALEHEIIGVFAATYGQALVSSAFLAEHFHVEGLHRAQVEILSDKLFLREKLAPLSSKEDSLFLQPAFTSVHNKMSLKDLDNIGYPMLFKQRDGYAKNNIFLAEHPNDIKELLQASKLKKTGLALKDFIVENLIHGDEITVVGFIENFQFHLLSISDKITSPIPPFIELEHIFPSKFQNMSNEITQIHQSIVDKLQLNSTPIVSEWKYYNGKFYLIEISPQIPGEYIGTVLLPRGLKYNFFDNLVALSIGDTIEKIVKPPKSKKIRIKYWDKQLTDDVWAEWAKRSHFSKILNPYPNNPPLNNHDRYGVMIFID